MRFVGLLVATVVLAVLAGGVYLSNRAKKAEAEKPAAGTSPKILAVPVDQIKELDFKKKDSEATALQRNAGGKWDITAPKQYPADNDAVTSVTGTLSSLTSDRVVEDKASDLAPYGLSAPTLHLTIIKKDNQKQELLIGDDAPTGSGVYVKLANDPRVFLMASSYKTSLDKGVNDFRDKRLLTFDSDKLSRVELIAKKQDVEFGRVNQSEWQIVRPRPLRADGLQVEELVRKLHDAKMDLSTSAEDAKKFVAAFGSGTPVATAKVTDAAGTQQIEVRRNKDDYYAKSSVVEGIYKVSNELGTGLDKGLDDFRNKKLFDFGFSEPGKIEVKDGTKQAVYQKSGEKWTSGSKQMDSTSVNAFIDKARDLSATKFVDQGFTTPSFEVTITSNDGKRVERVLISKQGNSCFAKRENEPSVYELDGKTVNDLQKAASDIKEAPPAAPVKKK